jgi:ankyrin repeat protein
VENQRYTLQTGLGLLGCVKHGITILMASVRANEMVMMKYILSQIDRVDIDLESVLGDTALTIACRLGRLEFVEMLLHHGAEINKETKTGRTGILKFYRSIICN